MPHSHIVLWLGMRFPCTAVHCCGQKRYIQVILKCKQTFECIWMWLFLGLCYLRVYVLGSLEVKTECWTLLRAVTKMPKHHGKNAEWVLECHSASLGEFRYCERIREEACLHLEIPNCQGSRG